MIRGFGEKIRLEITSADLGRFLKLLTDAKIEIFDLSLEDELKAFLTIRGPEFPKFCNLCEKCGVCHRITGRRGFARWGEKLIRRPILTLGCLLLILGTLILPNRIFFVQVEGNTTLEERQILAAAQLCGISFGASRRDVRSEAVKNALLESIPQLQWVGVNTRGCVAVISVRERSEVPVPSEGTSFANIVAGRDGVVVTATATKGRLLCSPGQAVVRGQILISGYSDSGMTIRADRAEGEVYARTWRSLRAVFPMDRVKRVDSQGSFQKISLLIGKNRINLWKDSGISDATCDRMYAEYYVTLPGGFQLPVGISLERYISWSVERADWLPEEGERLLRAFSDDYLKNQMAAGSILSSDISVEAQENLLVLDGSYICFEMIGKIQQEQIGVYNGESS